MDLQKGLIDLLVAFAIAALPIGIHVAARIANALTAGIKNAAVRDAVKQTVLAVEKDACGRLSSEAKKAEAVKRLEADGLGAYTGLIDLAVAELDEHLSKLADKCAVVGGGGA